MIAPSAPPAAARRAMRSRNYIKEMFSGAIIIPESQREIIQKIGTSVHSTEQAQEAQELGASYVTAGHIYATDCKKGLQPRGLDFLRQVCAAVDLPVYAIGGIKFDETQWMSLKECGAAGGCIMSGMMKA